jgi:hypothetical protein
MYKYKKKKNILRKTFQHTLNSLTGQRGEKKKIKNSRKLHLKMNLNLGLNRESHIAFNTKQERLTKASRFYSRKNKE